MEPVSNEFVEVVAGPWAVVVLWLVDSDFIGFDSEVESSISGVLCALDVRELIAAQFGAENLSSRIACSSRFLP